MQPEQLEPLLNTIHKPAVLIDLNYRLVAANKSYRQQYHFSSTDQYCYQSLHGYQQPCDREGELCPLRRVTESLRPERVMHVHVTPDGKRHTDVHMEPVFDEQGELCYFLEVLHEVKTGTCSLDSGYVMQGESEAFNRLLLELKRVADSDISVLLLGETGTGKELAARFLHENSSRRHKPFVTVECAGLTDSLFESELFGYVKGAFTGAVAEKAGLVASVDGGTLFLDELGDVPLSQQVKLLRLIETGMYRPVGGVERRHADFRLICATNKDLTEMMHSGDFREDLFYRISSFPVFLPPLRERGQDVILLARKILHELSGNLLLHFSDEALVFLASYHFPGNVRELRNMIERANLLRQDNRIDLKDIKPLFSQSGPEPALPADACEIIPLDKLESRYLQQLEAVFHGNKAQLAAALGISERTLYRKLKKTS